MGRRRKRRPRLRGGCAAMRNARVRYLSRGAASRGRLGIYSEPRYLAAIDAVSISSGAYVRVLASSAARLFDIHIALIILQVP
jgi:hypothetical protein